jgi:NarL family two-component system response regulator LiaR
MAKIRIVVADDQEVVRHGLRRALELESDMEVVGEARTGEEAVQVALACRPDVMLLAIKIGDLNGPELCRRILADAPKIAVVMLTSYLQDGMILLSLMAGAKGYILKDVELAELKKMIRSVARGRVVLDPKVAPKAITAATAGGPPEQREVALKQAALSEMDLEIIRYLAKGLSNKQIAALIHRSPHTVKDRLEKICAVLEVRSRTGIVAKALRTRLI